MGYTIGSGYKSSSVVLHQNHAILFVERQIFILNLKMPKYKWDDVKEPTINIFYNIDNI